mmetsp:Transcript_125393/g.390396  ORF Transcript_125393/g.390396 Transcript_125393/m.390396 type:complete len:227 (-) Transcript_125393:683-1363(-)
MGRWRGARRGPRGALERRHARRHGRRVAPRRGGRRVRLPGAGLARRGPGHGAGLGRRPRRVQLRPRERLPRGRRPVGGGREAAARGPGPRGTARPRGRSAAEPGELRGLAAARPTLRGAGSGRRGHPVLAEGARGGPLQPRQPPGPGRELHQRARPAPGPAVPTDVDREPRGAPGVRAGGGTAGGVRLRGVAAAGHVSVQPSGPSQPARCQRLHRARRHGEHKPEL